LIESSPHFPTPFRRIINIDSLKTAYNLATIDASRNHRRRREDGVQAEVTREWVTYKQAEELSGLSRTTLWKLLSAGEVKAARVGRAVRIHRRSLDGYLDRASARS
jgi:excisionase family DNA binding protein